MKTILTLVFFLSSCTAFATGSVMCEGKDVSVSWSVGHVVGSPIVGPVTFTQAKKSKVFCDSTSKESSCEKTMKAGYWVSGERIMINLIDEQATKSMFKMETWANAKGDISGSITQLEGKEVKLPVKCFME